MADPRAELRGRLGGGGGEPRLLDRLDEHEAARLLTLMDRAIDRQDRGLSASMEAVLSHAPRVLRGRITRVLFPEGG